jgi:hypothetical protein
MGWASSVYAKHYANPIPKQVRGLPVMWTKREEVVIAAYLSTSFPSPAQAVLGSAGFHRAEKYDPIWIDRVQLPENLTRKLFPQAEERQRSIKDAITKGKFSNRLHAVCFVHEVA